MIDVPNAGTTDSTAVVAPAAPGGAGPAPGSTGDAAALAERRAAGEALVKSGQMTQEQADAWLAPPAPTGPVPAGTASRQHIDELGAFISGLGTNDATAWLIGEVRDGMLTQPQADLLLAAHSKPDQMAGAVERASTNVKAPIADTDAEVAAAAARDERLALKYDFSGAWDPADAGSPKALAADKMARQLLDTAGFDGHSGRFVALEINKVSREWSAMNDDAKVLHWNHTEASLKQPWGNDFAWNQSLVTQFVADMDVLHPGTKSMLIGSGALSSPMTIIAIFNRARELADAKGITRPVKT